MATYKYTAISESGFAIDGIIEGIDKFDALNKVKVTHPLVESITEIPDPAKKGNIYLKRVGDKALSLVCNQFAIILNAGIQLMQSVELVAEQCEDKQMKEILRKVAEDVAAGSALGDSFEKRGPRLPTTFIETVRAGEESGNLDLSFRRLSAYFSKAAKTKQKATSALVYPSFIIVVAVIVVIVVMAYAVPTFVTMFDSMGTDLPALTKILIGTAEFFSKYVLIILALIVAVAGGAKLYSRTTGGKKFFGTLGLKIPVIGRINTMTGASQFANTMSTLMASGLQILQAIDITGKTMSNYVMGEEVRGCAASVETGSRLGDALKKTKYVPNLLIEMTSVGEESGSLEATLNVIGEYYDNEVDVATTRALGLLEPIIIVFIALFVVLLLLAVYIPMFTMYSAY